MTAPILTTAVFDVWRTLERMIGECRFPSNVANPAGVMTYFGDPFVPPQKTTDGKALRQTNERVVVGSMVERVDGEWGPIGRGAQEERFSAYVYVTTSVPGATEGTARDRLEELCRPVALKLREQADPDLDVSVRQPPELAKYAKALMWIGAVTPTIGASPTGVAGVAEIEVRCSFRINHPAKETA